ncbi:MAG: chromosome segregation protein SMC [Roseofilum sp. SID2]|uniref:chromosome segregation protein SMC n=1 Tax=unclassified Roseofilum TaxID=2620099 RepID=UPI001B23FFE7|nr:MULTISPECIES: chromosome segregation protein SMC [unclassified Roseofilum]MBP0012822.1 chromosome segregation protein SMC [Roseofilum sp. SID3]MBP0024305.1 chromosome segregation protein SMC [Roseofilum sp. SID2]MBP0036773.1 chromosome segregation protein SMC [Roseofilum sp. SID1]
MVHVKGVQLTNFKSFGGTTTVPLLPGFTVISGPNGSGKSNILDALLFCLGLSSSKGMRAERLPDLVNHAKGEKRKATVEASVTVTLDVSDVERSIWEEEEDPEGEIELDPEWHITRRLRVTPAGTYTSTYYMNGEACTLTQLHEHLNRLRIYPEGYNVVLQGDVTSIISMNGKARREIIDELAGVAQFDRKIDLAKEKLAEVKEKEENSRIIEQELISQRDRLAKDRAKAEKYQTLRTELLQKQEWEAVLRWRSLRVEEGKLREAIEAGDRTQGEFQDNLEALNTQISQVSEELDGLNARVKSLGEEQLLALQSTLATQQAQLSQLETRQQELESTEQQLKHQREKTEHDIHQDRQTLDTIQHQYNLETQALSGLQDSRDEAQASLTQTREQAQAIASASQEWVDRQTALNHNIEEILKTLEPQRTEQAQLTERQSQLTRTLEEQNTRIATLEPNIASQHERATGLEVEVIELSQRIQVVAQTLSTAEYDQQTQQQTQKRLLNEQRDKQRQLDKLEAQVQAQQEAAGTYASKLIMQTQIPGVHGLVASLGQVDSRYQLALEIAAGSRLGNMVVEDDNVAAQAIALLKQKRAGRATFLPLNKIRPGRRPDKGFSAEGFIDYAVNLIQCDPRYDTIFAYVFGSTAVFATLNAAQSHIGNLRMVTLEGELLEASGAMTGGSQSQRASLRLGMGTASSESAQQRALADRINEIEGLLAQIEVEQGRLSDATKEASAELMEVRGQHREKQLQLEQCRKQIQSDRQQCDRARELLSQTEHDLNQTRTRLEYLNRELPQQQSQLDEYRQSLAQLEENQAPKEWQAIQEQLREKESVLDRRELALRGCEQQLQELDKKRDRTNEKIRQGLERVNELKQNESTTMSQNTRIRRQQADIKGQMAQTTGQLAILEETLGAEKQQRDAVEENLRQLHLNRQQLQWQQQKLAENQNTRRQNLIALQNQIQEVKAELPVPLPEVPEKLKMKELEQTLRQLQKQLQALEPVNMLAIEEYEHTTERLEALSEKLAILEKERTELLLRVENFTTLRFRAFMESFDAVNENFQQIFAELSEGDGHLQLDNPEDPFSGGLNLIAHPKGKPVQRLASMSGGEKSLTALSFIFALQRYRPSPFYAFDEVDMFLDGANVERLSKMIKKQSLGSAQFIVVSLRRPMIEASERAIGVTQARGGFTQVLGITNTSEVAS